MNRDDLLRERIAEAFSDTNKLSNRLSILMGQEITTGNFQESLMRSLEAALSDALRCVDELTKMSKAREA